MNPSAILALLSDLYAQVAAAQEEAAAQLARANNAEAQLRQIENQPQPKPKTRRPAVTRSGGSKEVGRSSASMP